MPGLEVPRYSPVSRHDFPISEMEAWLQSWLAWIRSEKGTLSEYNQQARPMGCVLPVVAHGGGGGVEQEIIWTLYHPLRLNFQRSSLSLPLVSKGILSPLERDNPGPQLRGQALSIA